MNRENIIRMAKQAGLLKDGDNIFSPKNDPQMDVHIDDLKVFAALVASAEREACANLVDHILKEGGGTWGDAIRARGQA